MSDPLSSDNIQLTPAGMMTPKGIARVNAAWKKHQESKVLVCEALLPLVRGPDGREWDAELRKFLKRAKVSPGTAVAITALLETHDSTHEELTRAVCGAPSRWAPVITPPATGVKV